jgi:uncharacterized membrane protein
MQPAERRPERTPDLPRPGDHRLAGPSSGVRLAIAALAGLAAGLVVAATVGWRYGPLVGWMVAAAVFLTWVWSRIVHLDARETAAHAVREDPGRRTSDILIVVAAVASLGAVALLLSGASSSGKDLQALLGVVSVAVAWASVHTMYTTRYARLYYTDEDGGIDFNETDPPTYLDFAYLAFTIGMTFQVSDTDLTHKVVRATALRHALLSYLFGAVIVATTINLVAGLAK